MAESEPRKGSWTAWAQLVRLPNVFTILADVSGAHLLVAQGAEMWPSWLMAVLAGVSLYWAGMIFNDLWDIEQDRRERPTRPLPSGRIGLPAARRGGILLLVLGVVLAGASGQVRLSGGEGTMLPFGVSLGLVAALLLYDGPLKRTAFAPAVMGLCRVGSFLLGAASAMVPAALDDASPTMIFPGHVWSAALGFGIYVMGVTLVARREARETLAGQVVMGLLVILVGLGFMAIAPRMAPGGTDFQFRGDWGFSLLIALLGGTVLLRVGRLLGDSSPQRVQMAVKLSLLTIIPLAASFALLGAGPLFGFAIFALLVPATILAGRFRVT